MASRTEIDASYQDGVIRPARPLPELEGMALKLTISHPHGPGGDAPLDIKTIYPGPLIELGSNLAPMAKGPEPLLPPLIKDFRTRLRRATGFVLPRVRMLVSETQSRRSYRLYLNGVMIAQGEARMTRVLAIAPSEEEITDLQKIAGDTTREPVFGLPCRWILPQMEEMARDLGLTVASPAKLVASHLEELLTNRLPECLTRDVMHAMLSAARENSPHLVNDILSDNHAVRDLHKLFRELLRRKRNIGNITKILELVADSRETDVDTLAANIAPELPAFLPV